MPTQTISNSAALFLNPNPLRKSLIIQNQDASINIFLKKMVNTSAAADVSSTDHDVRLGPGASLTLNWISDGIEAIQSRYDVIAASGTARVSFLETEDRRR